MTRAPEFQRERSDRQIARILALVADRPMTARQVAATLHLHVSSINIYTQRLLAEPRRLHIAGHLQLGRGRPAPMYAAGGQPDVEFVARRKAKLPDRLQTQKDRVLELLIQPMTAREVAAKLSRTSARVHCYIRALRDEKKVYIKGWTKPAGRGDLSPVYALGKHRDTKKPRQTRAQRYQRDKADPEKYDLIRAQRRARTSMARALRTPNTWLNILGGAA